jgi:hypothetical protein
VHDVVLLGVVDHYRPATRHKHAAARTTQTNKQTSKQTNKQVPEPASPPTLCGRASARWRREAVAAGSSGCGGFRHSRGRTHSCVCHVEPTRTRMVSVVFTSARLPLATLTKSTRVNGRPGCRRQIRMGFGLWAGCRWACLRVRARASVHIAAEGAAGYFDTPTHKRAHTRTRSRIRTNERTNTRTHAPEHARSRGREVATG